MKIKRLTARYDLDELKKWASSGEATQAMKDIARETQKKLNAYYLSQLSARSPRRWRQPRSVRVLVDTQSLDLVHLTS